MNSTRHGLVLCVLAAAVFGGVWSLLHAGESAAKREAAILASTVQDLPEPPTLARIQSTLRTLKLVTVELRTSVESTRLDQSWRGDVSASVNAPVRLYYGCDLSGLGEAGGSGERASIRRNPITGEITLRVPRPAQLAAEVEAGQEQATVAVGWGRFRDLAGEYQLGQARLALHDRARRLMLSPENARMVEQTTRQQLVALVRSIVQTAGQPEAAVGVEFFDPERDNGVATAETSDGEPGAGR